MAAEVTPLYVSIAPESDFELEARFESLLVRRATIPAPTTRPVFDMARFARERDAAFALEPGDRPTLVPVPGEGGDDDGHIHIEVFVPRLEGAARFVDVLEAGFDDEFLDSTDAVDSIAQFVEDVPDSREVASWHAGATLTLRAG